MLTYKYPTNMAPTEDPVLTREDHNEDPPIMFSTINPDVKNTNLQRNGREQHATPSWARITSGDKQAGKMRGDNSTREARKEINE